ncbi:MAG: hypothetical protein P8126_08155 [Gammaproteobacteria bacterium]|jgi:hypothetical protein
MPRFCLILITFAAMVSAADAAGVGLHPPSIKLGTPSMKSDMDMGNSGQEQLTKERNLHMLKKDIRDFDKAHETLAKLSRKKPPENIGDKGRKEWRKQSKRLHQHAAALEDLSLNFGRYADQLSMGEKKAGDFDYDTVKTQASSVISKIRNAMQTYNADSSAVEHRQQSALDAVSGISLL